MDLFYCKTENGIYSPKYQHTDIKLAIAEAERLSKVHNTNVEILKVIGTVKWKPVPVTELKPVLEMEPGYKQEELEELPF